MSRLFSEEFGLINVMQFMLRVLLVGKASKIIYIDTLGGLPKVGLVFLCDLYAEEPRILRCFSQLCAVAVSMSIPGHLAIELTPWANFLASKASKSFVHLIVLNLQH